MYADICLTVAGQLPDSPVSVNRVRIYTIQKAAGVQSIGGCFYLHIDKRRRGCYNADKEKFFHFALSFPAFCCLNG